MPSAEITALADAIASDLTAASAANSLSQSFTAERTQNPERDLKSLSTLWVPVVPKREETKLLTRGGAIQVTYFLDVAVIKKVADTENATLDPLLYLAQQITDWFRTHAPTGRSERLVETETQMPYDPDHLSKLGTFRSVITLQFLGMR